ncbi:MAG: flagellar basal body-associated FliL family protein [Candidatus Adiutrix sp.]|jgi:flagellar FliL protein|nr:flagellar basal body-associated FliL family protein [Candidatus Adiutrix sp.]
MAKAPIKKEAKSPPPVEDDELKKGGKGAETEVAAPKKSGRLKLILLVVAAMVVGGGGAFAAMNFLGSSPPAPVAEGQAPAAADSHEAAPTAPQRSGHSEAEAGGPGGPGEGSAEPAGPAGPTNIELKPFIVNLSDAGGKRLLKLTMSIEAETPESADEVNAKMPQLRDDILMLLSSIQYDDVATMDGKQRLKNQMLNRVNRSLTKGKIKNIYFSEMVVQ